MYKIVLLVVAAGGALSLPVGPISFHGVHGSHQGHLGHSGHLGHGGHGGHLAHGGHAGLLHHAALGHAPNYAGHHDPHADFYVVPHYAYEYSVADGHTGDFKNQKESRDGDKVQGFYSFKESDGSVREVHYTADKVNGFNAIVKNSGHGYHPQHYHTEDGHGHGHAGHGGHYAGHG